MNAVHAATDRLAAIDLNLLVAFDALGRELSVTRAAARVGITQSAMSHALRRLRELLGDPLLVRGQGGMVLTPRGEALVVPLRGALGTMARALLEPAEFEAATARRAFTLAAPDLFGVLAIPPLLERVRQEAPGVDVAVPAIDERRLAVQLETGEVDMAIAAQIDGEQSAELTGGLLQKTLLRDRFVCLLRADHPLLRRKRRLTLETFTALSHALVSPTGRGPGLVDHALAKRGLERRIALRIPHFYPALAIVAKSDLVLTAPAALAGPARELRLVALPPPLPLPEHSINLLWHERFANDPGQIWLRGVLTSVVRALGRSR